MQKLLAVMTVLSGLTPQAGFGASWECFPLTEKALKATSWSISNAMHGADLTISLLNTGRLGNRVVTGATGLVVFVSATGEWFDLNLELETAIAPGAVIEQHYTVIGWDRLFAIPHSEVTVTTCVSSMEFADGGHLIVN